MLNLQELNESQRQAVTHGEGPLLVLAGPGSGKTFVITKRIEYLIDHMQVSPEEILVLTYTKAAAKSMESRFREQRSESVPFGTFHSIFYELLKSNRLIQPWNFMPLKKKRELLREIVSCFSLSGQSESQGDTDELLSAFSFYKNTLTDKEEKSYIPFQWRDYFFPLFSAYEKRRKQEGLYDYDDILYDCYQILKKDSVFQRKLQEKFKYILIDEMQDINPIQYSLLRLLSDQSYSIFGVGDDDQCIYGFRGSVSDCLQKYVKDFQAKIIILSLNYRSHPSIVRTSLEMIRGNKNRFDKELKAFSQAEGERVFFHEFQKREHMYHYLIQCFKDGLMPSGVTHSSENATELGTAITTDTTAVLFRTNAHMQSFARHLQKEGIPFSMKEKLENPYEHPIVQDLLAYLEMSREIFPLRAFIRIMNKPGRYLSREPLHQIQTSESSMEEIISCYKAYGSSSSVMEQLYRLQKQLQEVRSMRPGLAIPYVLRAVGYVQFYQVEAHMSSEKIEEYEDLLKWLTEEAKKYSSLSAWKKEIQCYGQKEKENREESIWQGNRKRMDAPIFLSTVHGAKGLEFTRVFIPECNEKVFPKGSMPDGESCEEERRILYVAMTRAKENLEILYTVGTKERPRFPSRFLVKINRKQFRQIHSCPGTRQTCPQPSHIHHHPQYNPEQVPR